MSTWPVGGILYNFYMKYLFTSTNRFNNNYNEVQRLISKQNIYISFSVDHFYEYYLPHLAYDNIIRYDIKFESNNELIFQENENFMINCWSKSPKQSYSRIFNDGFTIRENCRFYGILTLKAF